MIDLLGPQANHAVDLCKSAGITAVMITGDYAATALAIARQLGIASDDDGVLAVSTRAGIEFSVTGHRRVHAIAANGDNLRTAIESDFQRHAAYGAGTHVLPGALDNCVFLAELEKLFVSKGWLYAQPS